MLSTWQLPGGLIRQASADRHSEKARRGDIDVRYPLRGSQENARKGLEEKTMNIKLIAAAAMTASMFAAACSHAAVQITEFSSNSGDGQDYEFVEFTNTGSTAVDMNGWSQDDSTRAANKAGHILSAFGTLQPGESAIFTEATPDAFRVYWWGSVGAAPADLKIIGPYSNDNLSSSGDEINLYGPGGLSDLRDRLTYRAVAPGTNPEWGGGAGNGVTRNAPLGYEALSNRNIDFVDSFIGDDFGSFAAFSNPALIGNPGSHVPEPSVLGLIAGAAVMGLRRRRA